MGQLHDIAKYVTCDHEVGNMVPTAVDSALLFLLKPRSRI